MSVNLSPLEKDALARLASRGKAIFANTFISSPDYATRSTYRMYNVKGEKLATAVSYKDGIFQVSPVKKSLPDLEAWKAEHPSGTRIDEDKKITKYYYKILSKSKSPSLRHIEQYKILYKNCIVYFKDPLTSVLQLVSYLPWWEHAQVSKHGSFNQTCFTSFKDIGSPTETPDLWVDNGVGQIQEVKVPRYIFPPSYKEVYILLDSCVISEVSQPFMNTLMFGDVLTHCGYFSFYHNSGCNHIWVDHPYVFRVCKKGGSKIYHLTKDNEVEVTEADILKMVLG